MKSPKITYHHFLRTILLVVLMALLSCKTNKNITSKESITGNPKILFLNYFISKTENNQKQIVLINKIKAEGKLKQNPFLKEGSQGDLSCNLLNEKGKILESFAIKNPLLKTIEYVDETKHLKVKQLDLDSTQFSFRLQLKPNVTSISISEIDTVNKKLKPLIITNL
ncbi:hypothetical protein N1F78_03585 [Seonamhaeicola sp. MEBiC1930]|uniref:hypothetical protein n=1 Tax=Seonamhaeicola sp. MEBiC01930 TaxID=2976768 RepID=UPI003253BFAC